MGNTCSKLTNDRKLFIFDKAVFALIVTKMKVLRLLNMNGVHRRYSVKYTAAYATAVLTFAISIISMIFRRL